MTANGRSQRTKQRRTTNPQQRAEFSAIMHTEMTTPVKQRADAVLSAREKLIIRDELFHHMRQHPPIESGSRRGLLAMALYKAKEAAMALIRGKTD